MCTLEFDSRTRTHADTNAKRPRVRPLSVPNPIGLAAGFDKDGVIVAPMLALGFGFVEVGTVTPRPQEGNPKPRMFRLPEHLGIINRYGFNSPGADVVQANLRAYYDSVQQQQRDSAATDESSLSLSSLGKALWQWMTSSSPRRQPTGAIGINIGKNRESVEPNDVLADYTALIRQLGPLADYLVLNVSSPNTEGLRDWQSGQALKSLLEECLRARDSLANSSNKKRNDHDDEPTVPPLFVKLAPDLSDQQLQEIATTCLAVGIDGIVVTNTTNQRTEDLIHHHVAQEAGGLSGRPVKNMSTDCIRKLYKAVHGQVPIIGVGGIGSGHDAYEKICAGASLVQVYSMMVYEGPGVVSRIRRELAELMSLHGHKSVDDMVGIDHEDIFWEKRQAKLKLLEAQDEELYRQEREEEEALSNGGTTGAGSTTAPTAT